MWQAALLLTVLHGLPEGAEQPVILRVWDAERVGGSQGVDAHITQRMLQRFEAENPDIRVELQHYPSGDHRQVLSAARSGTPPDIAVLDHIWVAEFIASGLLAPLDEVLGGEVQARLFFKNTWKTCVHEQTVYCVPLTNNGWMELYYNRDLFRSAGLDPERPPATWLELLEAGRALTRPPNQYGLGLLGAPSEATVVSMNAFVFSNGGQVLAPDGKSSLINEPRAVEALEFYARLVEISPPGSEARREVDAVNLFVAGEVAIVLLGAWQQQSFSERAPFDWGVGLLPAPAGKEPHGTLGGWNLVRFGNSANRTQALRFIQFLSLRATAENALSVVPARVDAGRAFIRKRCRRPDVVLRTLEEGMPRPVTEHYGRIAEIEQRMVQQLLTGTSAAKAAEEAAARMDAVLQ